jgi:hypothetical protein
MKKHLNIKNAFNYAQVRRGANNGIKISLERPPPKKRPTIPSNIISKKLV